MEIDGEELIEMDVDDVDGDELMDLDDEDLRSVGEEIDDDVEMTDTNQLTEIPDTSLTIQVNKRV